MARRIDADALKKAIMAEPWKNEPNAVRLTVDYINIIIDEQPTLDAVPAVHGRCDYCQDGKSFIRQTIMFANDGKWHTIRYCPNCGAKMDLEVE